LKTFTTPVLCYRWRCAILPNASIRFAVPASKQRQFIYCTCTSSRSSGISGPGSNCGCAYSQERNIATMIWN